MRTKLKRYHGIRKFEALVETRQGKYHWRLLRAKNKQAARNQVLSENCIPVVLQTWQKEWWSWRC